MFVLLYRKKEGCQEILEKMFGIFKIHRKK